MTQAEVAKRDILIDYARRFDCRFFVETGTYKGDTVKAMLNSGLFEQIHTIDIYEDRVQNAQKRFAAFDNVYCWQGDSGNMLRTMIGGIRGPILFWLDAHHSGKQIARVKGLISTPIVKEIQVVLSHPNARQHVVLIDDARYFERFGGKYDGYPTEQEVRYEILSSLPNWTVQITDDIMRCHRREP